LTFSSSCLIGLILFKRAFSTLTTGEPGFTKVALQKHLGIAAPSLPSTQRGVRTLFQAEYVKMKKMEPIGEKGLKVRRCTVHPDRKFSCLILDFRAVTFINDNISTDR